MKMSNAVKHRFFVQDAERTQAGSTACPIAAISSVTGLLLGDFGWAPGGKRLHGLRAKMIKMITPYRK